MAGRNGGGRAGTLAALAALGSAALLAGCTSVKPVLRQAMALPRLVVTKIIHPKLDHDLPAAQSGRGGYYKDDGPGENTPANLADVPDAQVQSEPYSKYANRPYSIFGKTYTPLRGEEPFAQRGIASWYGKKFHGQRTSSGELYDMYKMTAAHPTLPIPSYARITSVGNGKQVVVRINDRGPFHASRVVDVSYTAALKLGLLGKGSDEVRLERLLPGESGKLATLRRNPPERDGAAAAASTVAASTAAADTVPAAYSATQDIAALMLEGRIGPGPAGAAPPVPAPAAAAAVAPGFYLQLGAFAKAEAAHQARARLAQHGAGLPGALEVVQAGAVYRLFSGPFETRAQAAGAASALPTKLGLAPLVVWR